MKSVVALLDEAEVPIRRATNDEIEYLVDGRLYRAMIHRVDRLPSTLPTPPAGRRLMVFCATTARQPRDRALVRGDVDLVVDHPREVIVAGRHFVKPRADPRPGRSPYTVGAIVRMMILAEGPLKQIEIGDVLHLSQQAVSRAMKRIDHLAFGQCPLSPADRAQLLRHWVPPLSTPGEASHWYGLGSPREALHEAAALGAELEVSVAAAGDLAAELHRPWRAPNKALIYADELFDLTDAGLIRAKPSEANVTLLVPRDSTVLATARWWCERQFPASSTLVADPVVVLQDLMAHSDYDDGAEGELRDWIIAR